MLKSRSVKNWFRAYLNLGLIEKILGHDRLIRCTAGSDFAFIDPWSDVWACNVRTDLRLGNLKEQSWSEIRVAGVANGVFGKVHACEQNCWMVTTARTAMRSNLVPQAPKAGPLAWVIKNKLKTLFGRGIDFERYVNYSDVEPNPHVERRSFLHRVHKVTLVNERDTVAARYPLEKFENT